MTLEDNHPIKAVLFDLDGVLVSTDRLHYRAWKQLADEEGVHFDLDINHRLRGVNRMQSLEIILERAARQYSQPEKESLCSRKNGYFMEHVQSLTQADWLPGARDLLRVLRQRGLLLGLCSSSRNARTIIEKLRGAEYFHALIDGHAITRTKPDPEIFLLAAKELGVPPGACVVFEDAVAGVEAARSAGMLCVGVGESERLQNADLTVLGLNDLDAEFLTGLRVRARP